MPHIQHQDVQLYYDTIGEGFPFIFLHGLGNSHTQMLDLLEPIEGIQFIILDQRSHGKSSTTLEMSFSALVEDVIFLADTLKLSSFYIGGISMGAAVSSLTALAYPERVKGLFLIRNAWCGIQNQENFIEFFKTVSIALKENNPEVLYQSKPYQFLQEHSLASAQSAEYFFLDPILKENYHIFDLIPSQIPFESPEVFEKIQQPTMILACHQDPIHPFACGEIIHKHIPHSKFYEITSKSVSADQYKKDVNTHLKEFIKNERF